MSWPLLRSGGGSQHCLSSYMQSSCTNCLTTEQSEAVSTDRHEHSSSKLIVLQPEKAPLTNELATAAW
jgi:hypothetical protein